MIFGIDTVVVDTYINFKDFKHLKEEQIENKQKAVIQYDDEIDTSELNSVRSKSKVKRYLRNRKREI